MQNPIATVSQLEGSATCGTDDGSKNMLAVGDNLHLDDLIATNQFSSLTLHANGVELLLLEPLQSVKLTTDVMMNADDSRYVDSIISNGQSKGMLEVLAEFELLTSQSILSAIEPVYEGYQESLVHLEKADIKLTLTDVLQQSLDSESLGDYLRFDQNQDEIIVYLSNQGKFASNLDYSALADAVLTIDTPAHYDSQQLLSFLIDNNLLDNSSET